MATLPAEVMARFPAAPLQTMRGDLGLQVQEAAHLSEQRDDGGACDGLSFLKDGVVLYAPTPNSRRQNFTLAHEVGHWLVNNADEIFDWLVEQRKPEQVLETLCDRIAQRLLLSEASMLAVVGAGPLRARHVQELFDSSQASMPVCAIALAAHLPGVGAVILVDREYATGDLIVSNASVRPDPDRGWPKVYPWPKQPVPAEHPLSFLKAGADVQRQTFWAMPWGERADFYMDAIALNEKRAVAILADTDLWGAEKFHPQTQREFGQRPEREVTCCGQTRRVRGFPCQTCDQVHCPDCGKCRCDRQNAALIMCSGGCFLSYRPNLLNAAGRCEECR